MKCSDHKLQFSFLIFQCFQYNTRFRQRGKYFIKVPEYLFQVFDPSRKTTAIIQLKMPS